MAKEKIKTAAETAEDAFKEKRQVMFEAGNQLEKATIAYRQSKVDFRAAQKALDVETEKEEARSLQKK